MEQAPINMDNYRLSRKILKLANLELRRRNRHLKELNLTYEQSDVLQYVHFHPGCSIKEVQLFLSVSHQTAQGIVSRMLARNLLEKKASETDRRTLQLFLSAEGKEKVRRIFHNGNQTGIVLTDGMSLKDQADFTRLIELAILNLQNHED